MSLENYFDDENLSLDEYSHRGPCSACVSKDTDIASSCSLSLSFMTDTDTDADLRSGIFELKLKLDEQEQVQVQAQDQAQVDLMALKSKSKQRHPYTYRYHHPFSFSLFKNRGSILFFAILLLYLIDDISGFQVHNINHSRILNVPSNSNSKSLFATAEVEAEEMEIIKPVQPLQSSTKEKRLSVQKAWERAQVLATAADSQDNNNIGIGIGIDDESMSMSATPFLDLFTDAGMATATVVKEVPTTAKIHSRPKGRPESVPGAMSRATLLNLNDVENRASTISRDFPVRVKHSRSHPRSVSAAAAAALTKSKSSAHAHAHAHAHISKSTSASSHSNSNSNVSIPSSEIQIPAPKKRGRGRPRKNKVGNDASVDEITSIAATIAFDKDVEEEKETSGDTDTSGGGSASSSSSSSSSSAPNSNDVAKTRKRRVKILPKARKMNEKDGETTGMMQPTKRGRNGEIEPPNLQRYYRTELLTQEEEYILGMKIQFLMKCEHVHEGLYLETGVAPTLVEWARSCGFTDPDPIRSDPNYMESDADMQIRPLKSEAWDEVPDPNMFVGNGLANDSGPGRGRGRAKKTPPTFLTDYYDDSVVKFPLDDGSPKMRKKDLLPLNRGSTEDFIEIITTAKEAKQRMVQCNMRLVVSISKRYKHVGVNVADLIQEGVIGLTRAAEKFDPKKGFKFSTYASWWIQQAVFRSIAYHSRTIRLPVHVHNLLNRVRRVRAELKRLHGRSPTNEEMAAEMDMPVEKFVKMLRLTRKAISLDMAKYQNNPKDLGHESDTSLGDTIDSSAVMKEESSPQHSVDRTLFRDDLKEMLKILGDDERAVICARYGIEDGLTRTVTTVAAQMGQSKSWVRSQECRALRKLRRPWYEKRLWEHQNSLRG